MRAKVSFSAEESEDEHAPQEVEYLGIYKHRVSPAAHQETALMC
jgi:hypothetical protein